MLINYIKKRLFIRKWKKENNHNETAPNDIFNDKCVSVGKCTYGRLNVMTYDDIHKLIIGNYCSIGPNVVFIVSADHYTNHISTYPFKVKITKNSSYEAISKGDIIVDDDVWIGYGSTILSGVHIGQGAIIAANTVVTKDVPPYAIVAGVPGKIIKYRFSPELIDELESVDYSLLTEEMIVEHENELYEELVSVKQLDWLPRKKRDID